MKFCNSCGGRVDIKIPGGDDHRRFVCTDCGTTHYQNPKIVTGCLVVWQDSVLLCRRAIEPRGGYWTVPAGFMELDETVVQGAVRETWEEARAQGGNFGTLLHVQPVTCQPTLHHLSCTAYRFEFQTRA